MFAVEIVHQCMLIKKALYRFLSMTIFLVSFLSFLSFFFGADMSTSTHIDNKKKDILVLRRGPSQGLESTLTAEKMYSINFTVTKKKFCLSLHYNGGNSYLFVNGTEIIKFKAKDSAIIASPLCLGNISKDWSTDKMKKTGLTGYSVNENVV